MKLIVKLFRFFFSLRYKVEIKGLELVKQAGGALVLPNHQALIDPQILGAYIFKHRPIVPVVTEGMYNVPVLNKLFRKMGAIPVSDLQAGSRDTDVLKNVHRAMLQALNEERCVLLYPAGQISGQGYEKIFNKQSAWLLVQDAPADTRILGVRLHGLWGSMWSRAWVGKTPPLVSTYVKAIAMIFANLLFFVPKRKVTIEFVDITTEARKMAAFDRRTFNNYLESFYNVRGEEPVLFLKHFFFARASKRQLPQRIEGSVSDAAQSVAQPSINIPSEVLVQVLTLLKDDCGVDAKNIGLQSNLSLDLGIDSVTMVAIINAIEQQFKVTFSADITAVRTVADLCIIAMGNSEVREEWKPSFLHVHQQPLKRVMVDSNTTIPQLFVSAFSQYKDESFAYDRMMGCSTRHQFMLKTMVVAEIIKREVPSQYVGIMLPAMQSTSLLIMATYMAGKTPVMLNWTVGKQVLAHCVESVGLTHIVTAQAFFDRVRDQLPESVKPLCMMFEKKVAAASLATKLRGAFAARLPRAPRFAPSDTAVILFTSGSESMPKAVPLTHQNILSNLNSVLNSIELDNRLILLGFLPPFHSFGFTVLSILPLTSGMKVAYSPDPTATRDLVRLTHHAKAGMILATPTFLRMMLSVADGNDFESVRYAVTGAESLHPSLIEEFKKKAAPSARIIEGYGITECAPILCLNPADKPKANSVGHFIHGVEGLIVDIQTNTPLPAQTEGMILVHGNNVFGGYIDKTVASPFVEIAGKRYYRTGDLGYIDAEGYLFITGRLKRFIKIAGEMISLPAIEKVLLERYGSTEETILAVEGSDRGTQAQIVLFCTQPIDLQEANQYLRTKGFSNLVKLSSVVSVDAIPVLGTGKIDYKVLKDTIVS